MAKKTNFGPDFSSFGAKCDPQNFFSWVLPLLEVKHCCRLSLYVIPRKTNEQTWENGQKPSFRTNFASYGPNLGLRNFFPGFYLYMLDIVASYHCMQFHGKLKNQTWETGKKTLLFGLILAQIWATKFFFQKSGSVRH